MESTTLERVKHLLETWDIRVLMLCSLLIQFTLTFLAPYRKRCSSSLLTFSMWLLYLGADSVALFTIGLIASHQDNLNQLVPDRNAELLTFWAPFLLLHLGGPDSITALALEDNELWHRHFLQLVTQVVVTLYVVARSVRKNHLLFPTMLMFFDGLIKYFERTCALYFASMEIFRDSQRTKPEPGPNYARLMEEYSAAKSAHIPTEFKGKDDNTSDDSEVRSRTGGGPVGGGLGAENVIDAPTSEKSEHTPKEIEGKDSPSDGNVTKSRTGDETVERTHSAAVITDQTIREAYDYYNKFKGLLADAFLSLKVRDESRKFFQKKKPLESFKMVQIELNFMYDAFYTKVFLLNRKRAYARIICFFSVIVSLFIFCFADKSSYQPIDVGITFALLGGALALDLIATFMFVMSDWWIIISHWSGWLKSFLKAFIKWSIGQRRSRWSESVCGYNLLKRCLKDPPILYNYLLIRRFQDLLIGWLYVDNIRVDEKLVEFIVEDLHNKAWQAEGTQDNEKVCSARGNLVFQEVFCFVADYLQPWTLDVDYDESLLTWHFATNICYWTRENNDDNDNDPHVKLSKTLSDYMSYLVLRQQALVSTVVGTSDIRFDDTCAEAKKFMDSVMRSQRSNQKVNDTILFKQFCGKLLEVQTAVRPIFAKGDKSKSVLFDSCCLAKQLKKFGEKQWEITSMVWVELLCFAAVRCSPRSHVALLSRGGELITLVWLLMAHLGLGERFRQFQGYGWSKLIIHK